MPPISKFRVTRHKIKKINMSRSAPTSTLKLGGAEGSTAAKVALLSHAVGCFRLSFQSQWFSSGVSVASLWPPCGLPVVPQIPDRWLCGLPVLFRWCPRGFPIGGSVASQWLPSGVPVASLWPPCGIPAIRRRPACNFSISRYIPPISRPYPACFFSISRYISLLKEDIYFLLTREM